MVGCALAVNGIEVRREACFVLVMNLLIFELLPV